MENDLNNFPFGYSYSRDSDNSPLLRLIFPNMLKIGRLNTRALDGPIRMPAGPGELMEKIEKCYSIFFKIWNTTMIPKLMRMYKWFDNKGQLQVGDIVWFKKTEKELSSDWTLGKVVSITKGRDGLVRRAEVQYQNITENVPRVTDRAVRTLIKLFNIEDTTWLDDMSEIEKFIDDLKKGDEYPKMISDANIVKTRHDGVGGHDKPQREEGVQHKPGAKLAKFKVVKQCKKCCCKPHCMLTDHHVSALPVVLNGITYKQEDTFAMIGKPEIDIEQFEEELSCMAFDQEDNFMSVLCALNTDLEEEVELRDRDL